MNFRKNSIKEKISGSIFFDAVRANHHETVASTRYMIMNEVENVRLSTAGHDLYVMVYNKQSS